MAAQAFNPAALRAAREAHGLSRDQLASAADVSRETVRRWEEGLRVPQLSNVLALALALNLTPFDLLTETEAAA